LTRALHLRRPRQDGEGLDLRFSLCGMVAVDVTDEAVAVTCRLCRRSMLDAAARSAAVATAEALDGLWRRPTRGASRLTAAQARAIERSVAGDDGEPTRARFRGWAALHEHRARVVDDGCPVRSTSDPGRFGARSHSSGGAVRMPSGRDDVIEVDRALAAATAHPRIIGPHRLEQAAQLAIYLARSEGRPLVGRIAEGRKGLVTTRAPLSAEQVAERLGNGWTAHHVGMLVRGIRADAGPILARKGILPSRAAEEGETVRIPGYDLDGWKEIADALGCSVSSAQRARSRGLPVREVAGTGRVVASRSEVQSWLASQVRPLDRAG